MFRFIIGFSAHILLWLSVMDFTGLKVSCSEICLSLMITDFPISLFYEITYIPFEVNTLILGSLWWGILAILLPKLFNYIINAFKKELGIR